MNYILIAIGAIIALYAKNTVNQNQYILIGGIMILMIGIYRISKNIPSRHQEDEHIDDKKE
ncbi:hypothetical protein APS56_03360 [Pseudalgibacter alginicilyticus]|uniref:Uncharacterized protein n=1 Tax=Pseudalgibacter alginicilyticus TaxID=1736674 RepID=A0A0P0D987_9FLAO|nr:hypothetical protein APS56_03360 [Pseudalgibacter alginicilyticus]